MRRVTWSDRALADLAAVRTYLDMKRPELTQDVLDRIVLSTDRLLEMPGIGTPCAIVAGANGGCAELGIPSSTNRSIVLDRRTHSSWPQRVAVGRWVKRIGLFGGSFNPAHRGHRRVTLAAMRALALDEVWWLVSPGNPLKDGARDMASLAARLASARTMARRAPIRATAIEADLRTRYTIDTIRALRRRYPHHRFVWLMGADNLAQFHRWRAWRGIARAMPIAVIARPGYDHAAVASVAMAWLRHFQRPAATAKTWTTWSLPALVRLRFRPDPSSATAVRATDPDWHRQPRRPVRQPRS